MYTNPEFEISEVMAYRGVLKEKGKNPENDEVYKILYNRLSFRGVPLTLLEKAIAVAEGSPSITPVPLPLPDLSLFPDSSKGVAVVEVSEATLVFRSQRYLQFMLNLFRSENLQRQLSYAELHSLLPDEPNRAAQTIDLIRERFTRYGQGHLITKEKLIGGYIVNLNQATIHDSIPDEVLNRRVPFGRRLVKVANLINAPLFH